MSKTRKFLEAVLAAPETDECILWPYGLDVYGYGIGGAQKGPGGLSYQRAHRLMCAMAHGAPSRRGLQAAHSCNVRHCVNPKHLRWATSAENSADQLGHGTRRFGSKHHNAKLPDEAVLEFRAIARQYADRYGCSLSTLARVLQKDTREHLPPG